MKEKTISRRMLKNAVKQMTADDIKRMSEKDVLDLIYRLEKERKAQKKAEEKQEEKEDAKEIKSPAKEDVYLQGDNIKREWAIYEVHQATGWSRNKIIEEFKRCKKEYGINRHNYCRYKVYSIDESNFAEEYNKRVEAQSLRNDERKAERQEAGKKNKAEAIERIMAKTGWSEEETIAKTNRDLEMFSCRQDLYYYFKFYELTDEEKATYLTQILSKKVSAKYDSDSFINRLLSDKERSNYFFADLLRRPWCVNKNVTKEEFIEIFKNSDKIFYKPNDDHQGNGAEKIDLTQEDISDVYDRLKDYAKGVVEGFVKQHPIMNQLSPTVVNTMRICSISSDVQDVGAPGKHKDIAYVSVKMGGVTGCVDNLAGGGMVAAVDVETGKIITNAIDEQDHIFEVHPVTGTVIKGFQIPYYKEAIQLIYDAIDKYHLNGYFGWDIAISEDGPELIETNVGPGVILHQLPFSAERIGVKHTLEKYL